MVAVPVGGYADPRGCGDFQIDFGRKLAKGGWAAQSQSSTATSTVRELGAAGLPSSPLLLENDAHLFVISDLPMGER
jgi:hypothetical protein